MKKKTKVKQTDYRPLITRNARGTVLTVPVSALSGFISIYPNIKKAGK